MPRVKSATLPRDDADDHAGDDASNRDGTFTNRVVSAASAPPVATTAINSVFGQLRTASKLGRPAGVARMPIDLHAVQIRSDVPVPPPAGPTSGYSACRDLLAKMGKGHSVLLAGRQARSLVSAARKIGIKVVARKMGHDAAAVAQHGADVTGVWRLS